MGCETGRRVDISVLRMRWAVVLVRLQQIAAGADVEVAEERPQRCAVELVEAGRSREVQLVLEAVPGVVGQLLSAVEAARTRFVVECKDFVVIESCTDSEQLVVAEA